MRKRNRTLNLTTRMEASKDDATLQRVITIYEGSDGEAASALYNDLRNHGPIGDIALNLFRACKCSARAKVYRGGGYKQEAYNRKQWSLTNLAETLSKHALLTWGWKLDPHGLHIPWVLYIDLQQGQVSFHTETRGEGPDYAGDWDLAIGTAPARICRFAADILDGHAVPNPAILQPAAANRKGDRAEGTSAVQTSLPF